MHRARRAPMLWLHPHAGGCLANEERMNRFASLAPHTSLAWLSVTLPVSLVTPILPVTLDRAEGAHNGSAHATHAEPGALCR